MRRILIAGSLLAALSLPAAANADDPAPAPTTDPSAWTPKEQHCLDTIVVIGHRGTGFGTKRLHGERFTEDTVPAFQEALALGMCGFETDYRSVRGGVVSLHDNTLNRTTRARGNAWHLGFAKVTRTRTNSGALVPSFDDVQQQMVGSDSCFQLAELKPGIGARRLREVVATNLATWKSRQCVTYTSTSRRMLARLKRIDPEATAGLIDESTRHKPDLRHLPSYVDRVYIDRNAVTPAYVAQARAKGVDVTVRRINTAGQLAKMRRLSITQVVTDRPTVIGHLLD